MAAPTDKGRTETGYSVKGDGRWHRTGKTDPVEAAASFAQEQGWPVGSWRYVERNPRTMCYPIGRRRFVRDHVRGRASPVNRELPALQGGYLVPPQ